MSLYLRRGVAHIVGFRRFESTPNKNMKAELYIQHFNHQCSSRDVHQTSLWTDRDVNLDVVSILLKAHSLPFYVDSRQQPSRSLRSSTAPLLHQPYAPSHFYKNSFSTALPAPWNRLTSSTRNTVTLTAFRSDFKTFLFNRAYHRSRHTVAPPILLNC